MSLASVRRQARAAADLFDACADAIDRGTPPPASPAPVPTLVWANWRGELVPEELERIAAPGAPWRAVPEPGALRTAARSLRRNPDGIGREPSFSKTKAGLEESARLVGDRWPRQWRRGQPVPNGRGGRINFRGIADALKCYGTPEAALEAVNRQLATIDPDDYPAAAVDRWRGLASDLACLLVLIEREREIEDERRRLLATFRPGAEVRLLRTGELFGSVESVTQLDKVRVRTVSGRLVPCFPEDIQIATA